MMNTARGYGFTIVELLVVLAVIAMLFSIALVAFSGIQAKSRDTRRIEDIAQIRKALNLYYVSHNRFPVITSTTTIDGSDALSSALVGNEAMRAITGDPVGGAYRYTYKSDATGATYDLTFCLETDKIPDYSQGCANTVNP